MNSYIDHTENGITSARNILITGSSGKTNCGELIRQILVKAGFKTFCPQNTDEAAAAPEGTDFVIRCVPFWELREIKETPDVVVLTNVSSYPLWKYLRYRDLLNDLYAFLHMLDDSVLLVMNQDYRFLNRALDNVFDRLRVFPFRMQGYMQEGIWGSPEDWVMMTTGGQQTKLFSISELLLQGQRNLEVYLAAVAAAALYTGPDVLREACLGFAGHPQHFSCYLKDRDIRLYIQLHTGLPSMAEAAFVGFCRRLTIVTGYLGDATKDQSFQGYAQMLSAYADRVILFGPEQDLIRYAVQKVGISKAYDLPVFQMSTGNQALKYALETAKQGDWILFVPLDYVPGVYYDDKEGLIDERSKL